MPGSTAVRGEGEWDDVAAGGGVLETDGATPQHEQERPQPQEAISANGKAVGGDARGNGGGRGGACRGRVHEE